MVSRGCCGISMPRGASKLVGRDTSRDHPRLVALGHLRGPRFRLAPRSDLEDGASTVWSEEVAWLRYCAS